MYLALLTGNIDGLLRFGWKIASAVGQVLDAADLPVYFGNFKWKEQHVEALASLRLAGVQIKTEIPAQIYKLPRARVIREDDLSSGWNKQTNPFFRELFALVRTARIKDHQRLLKTPADPDERWEVFADEFLGLGPT